VNPFANDVDCDLFRSHNKRMFQDGISLSPLNSCIDGLSESPTN
jgi:hypothetical protein